MAFFENLRFTSKIIPSDSTYKVRSTKIELKMKPADANVRWLDKYVYSGTADGSAKPTVSNPAIKNCDDIATMRKRSSYYSSSRKYTEEYIEAAMQKTAASSAKEMFSSLLPQVRYYPLFTIF